MQALAFFEKTRYEFTNSMFYHCIDTSGNPVVFCGKWKSAATQDPFVTQLLANELFGSVGRKSPFKHLTDHLFTTDTCPMRDKYLGAATFGQIRTSNSLRTALTECARLCNATLQTERRNVRKIPQVGMRRSSPIKAFYRFHEMLPTEDDSNFF